ncbi:CACTA en-spm transposon protein [Cucumis melo var. makuwa]|uniref:CACTA en-spm transposon protein n=1 Tax=Cucumis melo var. makuwa TaxID=1194695 RepID=A0A5A7SN33_CUCMM|nr:CACTA en-spm transposon protein [Cucumis melo var. makuwa]
MRLWCIEKDVGNVGDNAGSSSQQPATPISRRRVQSRLLELKRHVAINGRISMMVAPEAEKPIFPHYELAVRKEVSVDRVKLFRKTPVRARTFVSQAIEDAHNQMLELQSQRTVEGSQPLSKDEICDQVLGRRLGYSKSLVGDLPKARKTMSESNSMTSCSQSATEREIQIQAKLDQALEQIELQDRNFQLLASEME